MWALHCVIRAGDKGKACGTTGSVNYSFCHSLLLENIPATKYIAIGMVECVGHTAI